MKKLKIYTEHPVKLYYQAPYNLIGKQVDSIELIGSRFLYYTLIKINNKSKIFRKIRKIITGKDNVILNEPVTPILRSFIAPFQFLFSNNIILPVAACGGIIYYLLFLKLIGKNLIFHTGWPYISKRRYVRKPWLFNEFLWKIFFKNLKAIGTTKKAADSLEAMGCKSFQIPHSVDTNIFKPKQNNGKVVVLSVGRLTEAKGIRSILNLAEKFKDKARFVFVGSGPLEEEIKENKYVEFLGMINDRQKLADVYRDSDIFLLNSYDTPEWEELFGRVLIESMASGLAIIATNCVGPREIIEDGRNGFLIEQKKDDQLLNKFKLLLEDKELRERLGKRAREDALEKYDIPKVAEKWLKVINE
ncbi:MAG: hypothetical protein CMH62_00625 [Nanoarchaeota archaeon]|nr:hypothetical protein [Nanoarchaeota archaeon]|tara:strand:- start:1455 stop:2534 length:1080 start_codon:yes stop_codon:yes gene_type:complete